MNMVWITLSALLTAALIGTLMALPGLYRREARRAEEVQHET